MGYSKSGPKISHVSNQQGKDEGGMVLVELFHNSSIGPLSIPRIIEREQHYVI
jgi:hypothetical protein